MSEYTNVVQSNGEKDRDREMEVEGEEGERDWERELFKVYKINRGWINPGHLELWKTMLVLHKAIYIIVNITTL